jgi:endogenous inhibitor of DNA gyrase (YacG/DUF329 family)
MNHHQSKCAICRKPVDVRSAFTKDGNEKSRISGWFSVPEGWWVRSRSSELVQVWDVICPECIEQAIATEKHVAGPFEKVKQ